MIGLSILLAVICMKQAGRSRILQDLLNCPHCHVEYDQWQSTDNPLQIHRSLSPRCLFLLSPNPLNLPAGIPIPTAEQQFPLSVINAASGQPSNGLAKASNSEFSAVSIRIQSFDDFPGGLPSNTDALATGGFYFDASRRRVRCFYCNDWRSISSSGGVTPISCHRPRCSYNQQNKDLELTPRHH
jgi:hypothetical protein